MKTVEPLVHEHDRFRTLLDALEAAMDMRADTTYVMRELCYTLAHRLEDHIRRERELLAACRAPLGAEELMALAEGHGDECQALQRATWWLTDGSSPETAARAAALLDLAIAQFRSHMDAQEFKLYPALAWVLTRADRPVNRVARWLDAFPKPDGG